MDLKQKIISRYESARKLEKVEPLWHSDTFVVLDGFPNQVFQKYWDDNKKQEYILVENIKYYITYPLNLQKERK